MSQPAIPISFPAPSWRRGQGSVSNPSEGRDADLRQFLSPAGAALPRRAARGPQGSPLELLASNSGSPDETSMFGQSLRNLWAIKHCC